MSYVSGLFAFQSAFESVVIVKQPTCTWFRIAHGAIVTTAAPRARRTRSRSSRRAPPPDEVRGEHEREAEQARVAEDRQPGDGAGGQRQRPGGTGGELSVSSTSAAARSLSRTSRLTWTSCQTRYGMEREDDRARPGRRAGRAHRRPIA